MKKLFSYLPAAILFILVAHPAWAESKRVQAVAVRTVSPEMPLSFQREGGSGLVTVSFSVDLQGNVKDAKVEKSTHRELEEPTLKALKKWKFKPATEDGTPVVCQITLPIKLTIE